MSEGWFRIQLAGVLGPASTCMYEISNIVGVSGHELEPCTLRLGGLGIL